MRRSVMPGPLRLLPVIISLILGNAAYGQGQMKAARSLSVDFGAIHYRFIDEAFAHGRMQYNGTSFMSRMGYQRITDKHILAVQGGGGSGWTHSRAQWPDARVLRFWLSAGYARRILEYQVRKAPSTLYIGGQVASSNWVIENVDEYDEATVNGFQTINVFISHRTVISAGSLVEISLSLPVAGLVKRASYDGGINVELEEQYDAGPLHVIFDRAKFSALNPFRLPEFDIDFIRSIGPNTNCVLSYRFNYLSDLTIDSVRLYSNTLSVGLRFNFEGNQ